MTAPLDRILAARPALSPSAAQPHANASASGLRCQWCTTALPAGASLCPSCGSVGVPDPRLTSAEDIPAALAETPSSQREQGDLVEWWREDDEGEAPSAPRLTLADMEARKAKTFAAIGVAVAVCLVLGWLMGPLLAPPIERLTGTTIEHPSDLRGLGTMLGALVGMFIGAVGGWIVWSSK